MEYNNSNKLNSSVESVEHVALKLGKDCLESWEFICGRVFGWPQDLNLPLVSWIDALVCATNGAGAFEFSVASYNVLAQDLLEEHAYLYQHCDDQQLHWSYRRKNIMRQLNKNSPDVRLLCLGTSSVYYIFYSCVFAQHRNKWIVRIYDYV